MSNAALSNMNCVLCHVIPATQRVTCLGFTLPYCSEVCANMMHRMLDDTAPINANGGDKRKAEEDEPPEEEDATEKRQKRMRAMAQSNLADLTSLMLQRFEEAMRAGHVTAVEENMKRLQEAKEKLTQNVLPMEITLPPHVLNAAAGEWFFLPAEVRLLILSRLSIAELMKLRTLSPYVKAQIESEKLWEYFCLRGPLARLYQPAQRLCLRSWREQGLAMLQSHSYVVFHPHDPAHPVSWMPARVHHYTPVVTIHYDSAEGVTRIAANQFFLHKLLDGWRTDFITGRNYEKLRANIIYLRIGTTGRWYRRDANTELQDDLRWYLEPMPLDWKSEDANPSKDALVRRYAMLSDATIIVADTPEILAQYSDVAYRGYNTYNVVNVGVIHVFPTRLAIRGFPRSLREASLPMIQPNTGDQNQLLFSMREKHSVTVLRLIWKIPTPAGIQVMAKKIRESSKPAAEVAEYGGMGPYAFLEDWQEACTETALIWELEEGKRPTEARNKVSPTGRPGTNALEVYFFLHPQYRRISWTLDRYACRIVPNNAAERITPIPREDTIKEMLFVPIEPILNNFERLLPSSPSTPQALVLATQLYAEKLIEQEEVTNINYRPFWSKLRIAKHNQMEEESADHMGIAVLYKPSYRMALLPYSARASALQPLTLTHGVEGIASRISNTWQ
jgi:hypothetical protein